MGVGQSVIRDLPEEAGEIYVGDPNVANAIVRTAKRIYISGVANGHTSIFALAKDGRRIAFFQVSVGRAIGELTALLNVAIPGNEIRVRTVENTIILTGSVASAEEAQKALDIASGFVNDSPTSTSGTGPQISISSGSSGGGGSGGKSPSSPQGKVVNALTIRGADQVSLRVTVAEIRRDIIKQLGVNLSGSGPNGSFTLDTSVRDQRRRRRRCFPSDPELVQGQRQHQRHFAGFRATGRRPHARRADRYGGVRGDRKVPRRRHDSNSE